MAHRYILGQIKECKSSLKGVMLERAIWWRLRTEASMNTHNQHLCVQFEYF